MAATFQSPSAAVAVALGHQVLAGQAGQLLHAVEVLEGVGEGRAALGVQHLLHGDLFPGLVADGLQIVGGEVIARAVDLHQGVDLFLGDGVHGFHQLAHGQVFTCQPSLAWTSTLSPSVTATSRILSPKRITFRPLE